MPETLSEFMLVELRTLIGDLENGLEPRNFILYEILMQELRKQYDGAQPRAGIKSS